MTFKGLNLEDIKRTVDPTRWMQRIFAEGMMIKENFDVHFHILYLGVIKKQREVVGEDSKKLDRNTPIYFGGINCLSPLSSCC